MINKVSVDILTSEEADGLNVDVIWLHHFILEVAKTDGCTLLTRFPRSSADLLAQPDGLDGQRV